MPVQWTGLSPELLLAIDRSSGEQLRVQLERQLRDAIRGGRLAVDERLPSSRELARSLGLSRGLVQDAYAQLQAEGYLVTRVGSATRVAACAPAAPVEPSAERPPQPTRLIADFRHGVPDLASFPRADWLWAVREAARRMPTADLGYGDPRGSRELRTVVTAYVRRIRAAAAEPDRTLICSGYAQGLALALQALARGGVRAVAHEDPGSPATVSAAILAAGLTPVPVPVDAHGVDVAALEATGARAVVVTPAHQWPPASSSPLNAGTRCSPGPGAATRMSSRTTTTPSSATTGSRSALSKASRPTGWSRSAPSASPWPLPCASAGC